ncbi:MAG: DUF1987 domain-containing protein [Microscillaceae bacterium]|nr:DUF1987 domain-containing protein [Microscillaceae bacterium]MDW8461741.1 DUF1987 domain-containing protein [Cytophagales bacterium]
MDNIVIRGTSKTPDVNFDASTGNLEIKGRSIPENSYQFYEPLLSWLDRYAAEPRPNTLLTFKLDYFNTSSSMYILGILKKLEKIYLAGHKSQVRWFYDADDEDMLQTGEDLKQIVKIPIEMVEIDQEEA